MGENEEIVAHSKQLINNESELIPPTSKNTDKLQKSNIHDLHTSLTHLYNNMDTLYYINSQYNNSLEKTPCFHGRLL